MLTYILHKIYFNRFYNSLTCLIPTIMIKTYGIIITEIFTYVHRITSATKCTLIYQAQIHFSDEKHSLRQFDANDMYFIKRAW